MDRLFRTSVDIRDVVIDFFILMLRLLNFLEGKSPLWGLISAVAGDPHFLFQFFHCKYIK
jgi:hypothetical protein